MAYIGIIELTFIIHIEYIKILHLISLTFNIIVTLLHLLLNGKEHELR